MLRNKSFLIKISFSEYFFKNFLTMSRYVITLCLILVQIIATKSQPGVYEEHCCQNDLCPIDCLRCDGKPTCYDLSDELGCSNETDQKLLSYEKPPVFVPFLLNVVKANIRKEKMDRALQFKDRNCFMQPEPATLPPYLKQNVRTAHTEDPKEEPLWVHVLNAQRERAATTTTTQIPIWKLLLNKLKAEQNGIVFTTDSSLIGWTTDSSLIGWESTTTASPMPPVSQTPSWRQTAQPSQVQTTESVIPMTSQSVGQTEEATVSSSSAATIRPVTFIEKVFFEAPKSKLTTTLVPESSTNVRIFDNNTTPFTAQSSIVSQQSPEIITVDSVDVQTTTTTIENTTGLLSTTHDLISISDRNNNASYDINFSVENETTYASSPNLSSEQNTTDLNQNISLSNETSSVASGMATMEETGFSVNQSTASYSTTNTSLSINTVPTSSTPLPHQHVVNASFYHESNITGNSIINEGLDDLNATNAHVSLSKTQPIFKDDTSNGSTDTFTSTVSIDDVSTNITNENNTTSTPFPIENNTSAQSYPESATDTLVNEVTATNSSTTIDTNVLKQTNSNSLSGTTPSLKLPTTNYPNLEVFTGTVGTIIEMETPTSLVERNLNLNNASDSLIGNITENTINVDINNSVDINKILEISEIDRSDNRSWKLLPNDLITFNISSGNNSDVILSRESIYRDNVNFLKDLSKNPNVLSSLAEMNVLINKLLAEKDSYAYDLKDLNTEGTTLNLSRPASDFISENYERNVNIASLELYSTDTKESPINRNDKENSTLAKRQTHPLKDKLSLTTNQNSSEGEVRVMLGKLNSLINEHSSSSKIEAQPPYLREFNHQTPASTNVAPVTTVSPTLMTSTNTAYFLNTLPPQAAEPTIPPQRATMTPSPWWQPPLTYDSLFGFGTQSPGEQNWFPVTTPFSWDALFGLGGGIPVQPIITNQPQMTTPSPFGLPFIGLNPIYDPLGLVAQPQLPNTTPNPLTALPSTLNYVATNIDQQINTGAPSYNIQTTTQTPITNSAYSNTNFADSSLSTTEAPTTKLSLGYPTTDLGLFGLNDTFNLDLLNYNFSNLLPTEADLSTAQDTSNISDFVTSTPVPAVTTNKAGISNQTKKVTDRPLPPLTPGSLFATEPAQSVTTREAGISNHTKKLTDRQLPPVTAGTLFATDPPQSVTNPLIPAVTNPPDSVSHPPVTSGVTNAPVNVPDPTQSTTTRLITQSWNMGQGRVLSTDAILSWWARVQPTTIPSLFVAEPTTVPATVPPSDHGQCNEIQDVSGFCLLRHGQYKNQQDCRIYYVCSWGFLHLCTCPQNTLFDETLNVCNWEQNVTCAK